MSDCHFHFTDRIRKKVVKTILACVNAGGEIRFTDQTKDADPWHWGYEYSTIACLHGQVRIVPAKSEIFDLFGHPVHYVGLHGRSSKKLVQIRRRECRGKILMEIVFGDAETSLRCKYDYRLYDINTPAPKPEFKDFGAGI